MKQKIIVQFIQRSDFLSNFKVAEKFVSINGEGTRAGQLAVFIRFTGCNLNCSYCDTKWANKKDTPHELMTENEIFDYIISTGVKNVTITGGEPLLQKNIEKLFEKFINTDLYIEIETNGSVDIGRFKDFPVSFTMDYKLPSSDMESFMNLNNFNYLTEKDTIKFVSGSKQDLLKAYEIIKKYNLTQKCSVYISPVFDKINPVEIVEFMKENNLNGVNMQLQLHKFIWSPDKKGV